MADASKPAFHPIHLAPEEIKDPRACGLGEGERCCAFLTLGPAGQGAHRGPTWMCGRTIPGMTEMIRARLAEGSFNAKYDPGEAPFPECQTSRLEATS